MSRVRRYAFTLCAALSFFTYTSATYAQDTPPTEDQLTLPSQEQTSEHVAKNLLQNPLYQADMFALQGDSYRAITEYERYLMTNPPKDQADAVRLKVAWIYLQADKLEASANVLKSIIVTRPAYDRLSVWARLYYGNVAVKADQGNIAINTYTKLLEECNLLVQEANTQNAGDTGIGQGDCQYIEAYAHLGLASQYAKVHDFDLTVQQLNHISKDSPLKPKTEEIANYVSNLKLPRKRPVLAGALSIVPGLGHIYIEEYGSALVAAVWNGAFIWAFVDSLRSQKYGQATLIGVVEFVWYSGTIFGAVSGAHRFNRDARRIVEDGVLRDISAIEDQEPWISRFPAETTPPLQLNYSWEF